MKVEQLYTNCLAQGAYYLESNGEAAIIDPLREVEPYLQMAEERGAKIKYVFETHFHADFVSGHLDLAKKTGAAIVFGPNAQAGYPIYRGEDDEIFELGDLKIKLLHTPGHTMESTTYLLLDAEGKEHAIFTGDTLFIGDVGRPDLAVKTHLSQEDLAGHLYESLWTKIMPLADEVVVYPGHGAGSACGKNMSKETTDLLGNQKRTNYALQQMPKEEFVRQVTDGLMPPPQYFPKNVAMNKMGYDSIDDVMERGQNALSLADFEQKIQEGALILDCRTAQDFNKGFIKNSLNIGLGGSFAPWVGTLIADIKQPLVLLTEAGREEEAVMRLARVGYDHALGYLEGGFETWKNSGKAYEQIESISADEFANRMKNSTLDVLDVRKNSEFLSERVVGAENMPLDYLSENLRSLDKNKTYYVHCAGGYRSMVACSILRQNGYQNVIDVAGGFSAISKTDVEKTAYVCPSTLV